MAALGNNNNAFGGMAVESLAELAAATGAAGRFTTEELGLVSGLGNITDDSPFGIDLGLPPPTAPGTDPLFTIDPGVFAGFSDWTIVFTAFGGSEQGIFDLGSPTRRWRTLYCFNDVDIASDLESKRFIRDCELGTGFLMKLRPVSFSWLTGTETVQGLIAQEVYEAADGHSFSGARHNDDGSYSLRYNQFIAPLIKAVQEQQGAISRLTDEVGFLKAQVAVLSSSQG
jgi:hypothetical protein